MMTLESRGWGMWPKTLFICGTMDERSRGLRVKAAASKVGSGRSGCLN